VVGSLRQERGSRDQHVVGVVSKRDVKHLLI
jgi:hypothetical protein